MRLSKPLGALRCFCLGMEHCKPQAVSQKLDGGQTEGLHRGFETLIEHAAHRRSGPMFADAVQ